MIFVRLKLDQTKNTNLLHLRYTLKRLAFCHDFTKAHIYDYNIEIAISTVQGET
jgi:hypothetical protein